MSVDNAAETSNNSPALQNASNIFLDQLPPQQQPSSQHSASRSAPSSQQSSLLAHAPPDLPPTDLPSTEKNEEKEQFPLRENLILPTISPPSIITDKNHIEKETKTETNKNKKTKTTKPEKIKLKIKRFHCDHNGFLSYNLVEPRDGKGGTYRNGRGRRRGRGRGRGRGGGGGRGRGRGGNKHRGGSHGSFNPQRKNAGYKDMKNNRATARHRAAMRKYELETKKETLSKKKRGELKLRNDIESREASEPQTLTPKISSESEDEPIMQPRQSTAGILFMHFQYRNNIHISLYICIYTNI